MTDEPRINTSCPNCTKCRHFREKISHYDAFPELRGQIPIESLHYWKEQIYSYFCFKGKKLIDNPLSYDFCFLYLSLDGTDRASNL